MLLRPGRNVTRIADNGAVIEDEDRDLVAAAGEALDGSPPAEQGIGVKAAVGPDHLRVMAGGDERLVGVGARCG